jgi:hypothetical protein
LRRVPGQQMFERNSFDSRPSGPYGDNVRLDLGVHSPPPEPLGDRFGRDVGRFAEQRRVARLDLVSERCPLAVRDRWDPGRFCLTARCNRGDLR